MNKRYSAAPVFVRSVWSFALVAMAASPAVLAQTASRDDVVVLDNIVVTAAGFEQKLTDAPASVTIVTREQLQQRAYTGLADALRDVEGVDVGEATDKNGQPSISIRGLPSDYTLVLIDGKRQNNVGDLYPNNFGGGQFSYVPPLEAISRIEIIRGPASTLYGSDAIGGVVNIITRKVTDAWHGSFTTGLTLQEESEFGDEKTSDLYLSGPVIADKLGMTLRGSFYDRNESLPEWESLPLPDGSMFDRSIGFGGGGQSVGYESWNAGGALSFTPTENQDLVLDYNVSKQTYDNTEGQTGTLDSVESLWRSANATVPNPNYDPAQPAGPGNQPTMSRRVVQPRVGYTPEQRTTRTQLSLTHNGRWSFGNSEVAVTKSTSENLGRSLPMTVAERDGLQTLWNDVCARRNMAAYCNNGTGADGIASSALTDAELARLNAYLPRPLRVLDIDNLIVDAKLELPLGAHQLTVGGQYFDAEMEDGTFGMDGDGFRDGTVQPHEQWAVFAEDNWTLLDALTATAGVRYDDHNIFGSQVSPRGYLVWRTTEALTIKGGVSTGYKTPKPNQLFPGITGFGGQGVSPMVGTPDLQPETSVNYELAAYYEGEGYNLNLTAFMNRFKDKIASGDNIPNCEVAAAGAQCVDIGTGWAELGYLTFGQSFNVDRAETQGLELAGRVELPWRLSLRGNFTLTDSEQKSGINKGAPITGNPAKYMANATLAWATTPALNLSLVAELRADRYRDRVDILAPGSTTTVVGREDRYYRDYQIFHLGASYKASDMLTFNGRINNLLNKDFISQTCNLAATGDSYSCLDDYLIKDRARNYWVGATMRF